MQIRWIEMLRLRMLVFCIVPLLVGCATSQHSSHREPSVSTDATPPPEYAPHYVREIAKLPPDPSLVRHHPVLEISRIDAREPNHVRVYAELLDADGHYLSGATLAKYKSRWSGVTDQLVNKSPVEIKNYKLKEVTEAVRVPTALAIVMDHSGSMGEERAQVLEQSAGDLIDMKRPEDAYSIIKFDEKVDVEVPLTKNSSELKSKFQHNGLMGYGGGTAIMDGIATGLNALDADTTDYENRVIALFTDGMDNASVANKDSLMHVARHSNTSLWIIGFGDDINESLLRYLAQSAAGSYRHVYGTHEIGLALEDLYKRLHNFYEFDFAPPSYGLHTVKIQLCLPHDTLSASGTYDNTPTPGDVAKLEVYFDLNSSKLLPASNEALNNVVKLMTVYPSLRIELRGYTDSTNHTSDPDFNKKLSQKRSDIVKEALVKRGIAESRIKAVGYGATQPIAENTTESGRAKNRRTEFVIEGE